MLDGLAGLTGRERQAAQGVAAQARHALAIAQRDHDHAQKEADAADSRAATATARRRSRSRRGLIVLRLPPPTLTSTPPSRRGRRCRHGFLDRSSGGDCRCLDDSVDEFTLAAAVGS